MPVHWWADDETPCVRFQSSHARTGEITALFREHHIPYDTSTLLALVRLTWKAAGELVYDSWRTSSIEARRPAATERVRRVRRAPALPR